MSIPYRPGDALTCQQVRELDVLAIEHVGIPGLLLMENAGRAAAEFVYATLVDPRKSSVLILAGPGNNGGDGFVVARHLRNGGVDVAVALATPRQRVQSDAAVNLSIYSRLNAPLLQADEPTGMEDARNRAGRADVIVDALLGTGAGGPPRGVIAALVELANAMPRARRVAIDVPTGLDADHGEPHTPCFRADATVTFVAEKVGFEKPAARSFLGRVVVADIGVPLELIPGRTDS
ncbi:MAG: NAD(P)H-hydrate epimerase [Phycisphaerae bacterium]